MSGKLSVFFIFSLMALAACTQEPAAIVMHNEGRVASAEATPKNPFKIKAKEGDTIYSLAKENGVETRDLIELNRLRPPYVLEKNQTLRLPQATFHIVSKGDTIYAISRSYGVDMGRLMHINHMSSPDELMAETKIRIPSAAYSSDEQVNVAYNTPLQDDSESDVAPETATHLREVISKDLGLLDKPEEKRPLVILPDVVKKQEPVEIIDPNAPKPTLKANSYPAPTLKPGTEYAKAKAVEETPVAETPVAEVPVVKKYEKAAYTPYIDKKSGPADFLWPVHGRVVSRFGPKQGGLYNDGINISAKEGAAISAADDGRVVYSGNELRGYGNLVLVKHDNGYMTAYAHTKDVTVKKGDTVKRGQIIAHVGKTGHVTSPQLHFSIRKGRKAINPEAYLSGSGLG